MVYTRVGGFGLSGTLLIAHRHAKTQGFIEFTSGKQDPEKAPGDLGFGASFKPSDEDEFNALQVRCPCTSIRSVDACVGLLGLDRGGLITDGKTSLTDIPTIAYHRTQLKELKNGRLAMVSVMGALYQVGAYLPLFACTCHGGLCACGHVHVCL